MAVATGAEMVPTRVVAAFSVVAVISLGMLASARQPANQAGSFRAEQATAGKAAHEGNCAARHLAELARSIGPPPAGPGVRGGWAGPAGAGVVHLVLGAVPPRAG